MEELNLERQLLRTPQRLGCIEANVARLVVSEVPQRLRQDERGFGLGSIGQLAGAPVNVRKAERISNRRRRSDKKRNCCKPKGLNHGNNGARRMARLITKQSRCLDRLEMMFSKATDAICSITGGK